uniref:Uncharacterized protein n=1 Tax=Anguilla anguilla TaxID=7936 RepID=A0A0E9RLF1_ANGAN
MWFNTVPVIFYQLTYAGKKTLNDWGIKFSAWGEVGLSTNYTYNSSVIQLELKTTNEITFPGSQPSILPSVQ